METLRRLSPEQVTAVQAQIDASVAQLRSVNGFIGARPGFRLKDGQLIREPAVVVYVEQKRPELEVVSGIAPTALGPFPVDVRQLSPQIEWQMARPETTAAALAASYTGIDGDPIDQEFQIDGSVTCHVGPDSGWVLLRDFIQQTQSTFDAAIYDFKADYIAQVMIDLAGERDVQFRINIDNGLDAAERALQKSLANKLGARYDAVEIPCNGSAAFPTAYHEKVIVRDDGAIWISSGNWTKNSQPPIDPVGDPDTATGMYKNNREYHAIFEQPELAAVFKQYMQHDRDQVGAQLAGDLPRLKLPELFVSLEQLQQDASLAALAAPEPIAPQEIKGPIRIRSVLSPDNYATRIDELIRSAKKSLDLQYSYITWTAKEQDADFRAVLEYLGELSWRDDFTLRVIVGHDAEATAVLAENGWNEACVKRQRPIHNKTIIVDGKTVLVSSTNWSGDGFLRNRDAGIIFYNKDIAQYYQGVFDFDWDNRAKSGLDTEAAPRAALANEEAPAGMVRMRWEDYYGD